MKTRPDNGADAVTNALGIRSSVPEPTPRDKQNASVLATTI
jgi:hypothetical protein